MPNWCVNSVVIDGNSDQIDRAVEAVQRGNFLETFAPLETEWGREEAVNRWGTKWDPNEYSVCERQGNSLILAFDSAWSPPVEFYAELVAQGMSVSAKYFEPGMAFYGYFESQTGEQTFSYQKIVDIPEDIVQEFSLEDWISDLEDEE